ncbi:hypothetical protein SODALDRAFT_76710 [Sodiomyces alkalinus F11]|uniref:Uncharacterized protein n=1 Tax=Sodiomyces alkalinus (strain CBS 110278 / VKM F-3762 / F11) TaxID=1314773 RepID=A0A3N2PKG5_SODAK|nr:hypothetical protein SODALDRAFT_76710 [Sodiomyces alkalinus F11]ROT35028.1 hypothetical protein SODALDRAFT_76710 [Sodiomyces alkalinus F11]
MSGPTTVQPPSSGLHLNTNLSSSGQANNNGDEQDGTEPSKQPKQHVLIRHPDEDPNVALSTLKAFKVDRLQCVWALPASQIDDSFVREQYSKLLLYAYRAIHRHFAEEVNFAITEERWASVSPWAMRHVIENDYTLEEYVESVARPHPVGQSPWDTLLASRRERRHVLVAVVLRMLHEHAFDELLFGASRDQAKILRNQDRDLVSADAFKRATMRAEYINMFLERNNYVPSQFWAAVDDLTYRIVMQLYPTYAWISTSWRRSRRRSNPQKLFQSIHNVVAHAGWLAVQIRRVPASVVVFDWAAPGERWMPTYKHCDSEIFQQSVSRVEREDEEKRRLGREPPSHVGRVLVSIAPRVERYAAAKGGRVRSVLHPVRCVCYYGIENEAMDANTGNVGLRGYSQLMKHRRERREFYRVGFKHAFGVVLVAWVVWMIMLAITNITTLTNLGRVEVEKIWWSGIWRK